MSERQEMAETMAALSQSVRRLGGVSRSKPLVGGAFGASGYVIASRTFVFGGLDAVHYLVMTDGGFVLACGETKASALSIARTVLRAFGPAELSGLIGAFASEVEQERRRVLAARREFDQPAPRDRVKSIPKRRREIFEAGGGACHYCATPLQLDGKWHIEHKMPKALLGSNERANLVPSCVPCNLQKRDKTDQEFIAAKSA